MPIQKQPPVAANMLRMIPTKWAIVIVALLIAYVLIQPKANQWFGWNLPSLAAMVGGEKKPTPQKADRQESVKEIGKSTAVDKSSKTESKTSREPSPEKEDGSRGKTTSSTSSDAPADSKSSNSTKSSSHDEEPLYGFLVEVGRNRYESPAGLVYGPGSEEGHRLKHLARHLEDQPNRPGSHGVFEGGMKAFLQAIDKAIVLAKKGGKGTKVKEEDDSTVYEAPFDKPIGYIGGSEGKRRKNPACKKLRIVVRGESVITAFPIQ
jgi:hypothetical protein